jgi:hypothetical protein
VLTIAASTLSLNSAMLGGSVYNQSFEGVDASILITVSTLTGNSATAQGGAVYNDNSGAGRHSTRAGPRRDGAWRLLRVASVLIPAWLADSDWERADSQPAGMRWTTLEC